MVGKLVAERTILFVCDIQERFRSVIHGYPIKGAAAFNIPIIVTEQYPKALGSTVAELTDSLPPGTPVFPKKVFSMFVPEVANLLAKHQQIKQHPQFKVISNLVKEQRPEALPTLSLL